MATNHIAALAGDSGVRQRAGRGGWPFHFAVASTIILHPSNHPHFAHFYRLFYRDFERKAFGRGFA